MQTLTRQLKSTALALTTMIALASGTASAQALSAEQARAIIAPFYDALNTPSAKNVPELVQKNVAADWRSFAGEGNSKGRDEVIAQLIGFGKAIPDLKWDIREVLVSGDRIIVRSEASGTPAGAFFGVPHGGRTFRVMAIDIHTVKDGKLVAAYHIEDWAGAIRQLSAR